MGEVKLDSKSIDKYIFFFFSNVILQARGKLNFMEQKRRNTNIELFFIWTLEKYFEHKN